MNLVDVVILLMLALSALLGFRSGFIQSVCSLAGLIAGIIIASWNYQLLGERFSSVIHSKPLADAAGFCVIAIVVMIVAGLIGLIVKSVVRGVGLGWLDSSLGLIFGLLRGAFLATLCIVLLAAFFPESQWLAGTRVAPYFMGLSRITITISPGELRKKIEDGLHVLEKNTPEWLQQTKP